MVILTTIMAGIAEWLELKDAFDDYISTQKMQSKDSWIGGHDSRFVPILSPWMVKCKVIGCKVITKGLPVW